MLLLIQVVCKQEDALICCLRSPLTHSLLPSHTPSSPHTLHPPLTHFLLPSHTPPLIHSLLPTHSLLPSHTPSSPHTLLPPLTYSLLPSHTPSYPHTLLPPPPIHSLLPSHTHSSHKYKKSMMAMLTTLVTERGLDSQNYHCAGCKRPIGISKLTDACSICMHYRPLN